MRISSALVAGAVLLGGAPVSAFTDLAAGKRLTARTGSTAAKTRLAFKFARDPGIAGVENPLCPAETTLRVVTDMGVHEEPLDCASWAAAGGGYRYRDTPGGPGTSRKITYKLGKLVVKLRGGPYGADPIAGPVAFVETRLRIGPTEYCGRWDDASGTMKRNEAGTVVIKGPTGPCQVMCGDGVVLAPEACDDGNTQGGDCCAADCALEADGSACSDGSGCSTGDACLAGSCVGTLLAPWINEFDYDDFAGAPNTDRDEFVEIAGPAGTDLGGYQLIAVEGGGGACGTPFFSNPGDANMVTTIPDGTVLSDDTGTGIGFLVACFTYTSGFVPGCDVVLQGVAVDSNLKNGHLTNADEYSCPDGILLLDGDGALVDAVSYEGQVPNVGAFGPFFHVFPPYSAERDEGWLAGVSIEKTTSTLARAASGAEWRDPSELGGILCTGQLGLLCPTQTRTPGTNNPLQSLACGSPSGAFL